MTLKGKRITQGIVDRRRWMEHSSVLEIVGIVSEAFGTNREAIMDRGDRANRARKVAIYFCQRYTGLSNEAIGKLFGGIHYSTVSKVASRVREERDKDKKLSKLMDQINSHFKA